MQFIEFLEMGKEIGMGKFLLRKTAVAAMSAVLAAGLVPANALAENDGYAEGDAAEESGSGYQLVWADEFDGESLNTEDWNVETHEAGWVNAELQRYTSLDEGNIEVSDGTLKIKPHINIEESAAENEESNNEESENDTLAEAEVTDISFEVKVGEDKPGSETMALQINFGKIDDSAEGTAKANVVLSDISLLDEEGNELLKNTSFENGGDGWSCGINSPASGSSHFEDGKAYISIENSGDANWNIQLQQGGITLESGKTYKFSMKATSDADRETEISLLDPENGYNWYGGSKAVIKGKAANGGENGSSTAVSYGEITSGRITTQRKHDFTYGRFEARAKVPTGKGYLPAFWLMATDEGFYGQWPKCGEIDIMEVMGQNTSKSYHTIHYGYDSGSGHKENQGAKVIEENGFSDDFHVFTMDWDPGKITWYVDGEEVYTTSDWYTGTDDDNQITYPAPFDQNFYVILNLAVGGSWVGYPGDEEKALMNEKAYEVDYVRVYQKSREEYEREENEAKRPEKEISFREADENGNYVINGEFKNDIGMDGSALADKDNWKLHLESDASGATYALSEEGITIIPDIAGSQPHSIQLKQENIPMYKGWEYELTFDAYSTEERNIVVDVEGPDRGWKRYLQDTTVTVGPQKQSYTLNFSMSDKNDSNGSLEFNLGKQPSTAPVTITNVKLVHKSGEEIKDDGLKVIRPDGNYIYNGSFDQGDSRLGYWEIEEEDKNNISVLNAGGKRELKVVVPDAGKIVKLCQSNLSPIAKGTYALSFNARCEEETSADGLSVNIAGEEFEPKIGVNDEKYSKQISFENDNTREESYVEILFKNPGTYYVDNLFLSESALIKNGSFNAGLAGFSPYIYDTVSANYVVDSMNGNDNAFAITINDTIADDGGNSWYVQLNQDGITLEEGKKYRLSFKAKSSIDRVISYAMQQFEGNWTNYSETGSVEIGNEWKTFTKEYRMNYPTDTRTRFNITMGSVDGIRITQQHSVYIDDISLVEIDEIGENPDPAEPGQGDDPDPENPGQGRTEVTDPEEPNPEDPQNPNPDDPGQIIDNPDDPENPNPQDPGEVIDNPENPDDPGQGEVIGPEDPGQNEPETPEPVKPEPVKPRPVPAPVKVVAKVVKTVVKTVTKILRSIFGFFR